MRTGSSLGVKIVAQFPTIYICGLAYITGKAGFLMKKLKAAYSRVNKNYQGQLFFSRKNRPRKPIIAPILHRIHPDQRTNASRQWGKRVILVFTVLFVVVSLGTSYLLSGGQELTQAHTADVHKNDIFYRFFAEDKAKDTVQRVNGEKAASRLQIYTYEIGRNDSLSRIAQQTGSSIDALISINNIQDAHMLRVGAKIKVPNQSGIYYRVANGETLESIAKKYAENKVSVEDIKIANAIDGTNLKAGMTLFLPGAKLSRFEMEKALGLIFRSPALGGRISSAYGYRTHPISGQYRFHPGIDIALPYWTPIRAIREGRVTFSGWRGGYGKLVILSHSEGYGSWYGHMIKYIVSAGQWVRAGQVIGYVGSTGNSTGPHLHFELRRNGQLINPFSVNGFRRAYQNGF
jgi:murein DD-endopeptidase MepM/ murein hydrolase activator NlpD